MRLKGVNPFEQHFEKAIAGVFALGLLGVVAWQFLGPRNTVKIGGKDEAPIDQAYERVAQEAQRTLGKLEATNVEKPAGADVATESLRQFQATFKGPVAPAKELAVALDRPSSGLKIGDGGEQKPGAAIAELKLPATATPIAATHLSTIDASEVAANPDVASVLPKEQPFDKAAVTVETTIDGTQIKAALGADPDGDGPIQAIPRRWWETSGVQIIGVELERSTLQPDGSFSTPEVVKAMPGRQATVALKDITTATVMKDAMKVGTETPALIRRPEYYRSRFGDKWVAPSERKADLPDAAGPDDKQAILNQLKSLEARVKRASDELAKVGQPPAGGTGGGGGRGGGGAGGKGGGGGGGGGGAPPPPPGNPKADEARRRGIQKQIDELNKQIMQLREKIDVIDGKAPVDPAGQSSGTSKPKMPAEAPLLENSSVRLWAHDVFVERGKTYRYRVVVALNNPYFGHGAAMTPEQAPWAASAVVRTPASEWSEPVQVEQENFFFVTSATEDDQVGRASSARAEVYEFKWGYWRRGAVVLEPGDTVQAEIKVPDLSKVAAAPTPDAPPATPGGGTGGGRRGGGKGGLGGGDGGGGGVATPPPPGTGGGQGDASTPGGPIPMETITIKRDTLLVGVSAWSVVDPASGRASPTQQVLFREPGGMIVTRVPLEERDSPEYRRIARNADRGLKELENKKPEPAGRTPPEPPPVPGGGGGPGGGGTRGG